MAGQGLLEAIQTAMQAERSARQFYLRAAEKTSNARGKALLLELADFEAYHEEKLRALARSLNAGQFLEYEGKEISMPKPEGSTVEGDESDPKQVAETLTLAMDAEEKAQQHYERLAERTEDPLGKAMFRRLAEEEAIHHRILSDEFYSLSNDGLWVWAE